MLASMKRSTQFCMQGSSYLSSFPELILLVMHFLKQVSVREWIAVCGKNESAIGIWKVAFLLSQDISLDTSARSSSFTIGKIMS